METKGRKMNVPEERRGWRDGEGKREKRRGEVDVVVQLETPWRSPLFIPDGYLCISGF